MPEPHDAQALLAQVSQLLIREAQCLDERRWEEWLDLMTPDVEFWVPAWHGENELTCDPQREMSLMYYPSRQGLEDRVYRVRTGRSVASDPLPRTCHFVTNIRSALQSDGTCQVDANWQTLCWRRDESTTYFGHYQYVLTPQTQDDAWRIRRKKVVVLNSLIVNALDFYLL